MAYFAEILQTFGHWNQTLETAYVRSKQLPAPPLGEPVYSGTKKHAIYGWMREHPGKWSERQITHGSGRTSIYYELQALVDEGRIERFATGPDTCTRQYARFVYALKRD